MQGLIWSFVKIQCYTLRYFPSLILAFGKYLGGNFEKYLPLVMSKWLTFSNFSPKYDSCTYVFCLISKQLSIHTDGQNYRQAGGQTDLEFEIVFKIEKFNHLGFWRQNAIILNPTKISISFTYLLIVNWCFWENKNDLKLLMILKEKVTEHTNSFCMLMKLRKLCFTFTELTRLKSLSVFMGAQNAFLHFK